jgi:hypothetical protein
MSLKKRQQIGASFMIKATLLSVVVVAVSATSAIIHAAIIIDPVSATDNGHYAPLPGASATMTINGSGLSDGGASVTTGSAVPGSYPTVTADPSPASFYSNYAVPSVADGGPTTPTIVYTLVANPSDPGYTITGGHFWQ